MAGCYSIMIAVVTLKVDLHVPACKVRLWQISNSSELSSRYPSSIAGLSLLFSNNMLLHFDYCILSLTFILSVIIITAHTSSAQSQQSAHQHLNQSLQQGLFLQALCPQVGALLEPSPALSA